MLCLLLDFLGLNCSVVGWLGLWVSFPLYYCLVFLLGVRELGLLAPGCCFCCVFVLWVCSVVTLGLGWVWVGVYCLYCFFGLLIIALILAFGLDVGLLAF